MENKRAEHKKGCDGDDRRRREVHVRDAYAESGGEQRGRGRGGGVLDSCHPQVADSLRSGGERESSCMNPDKHSLEHEVRGHRRREPDDQRDLEWRAETFVESRCDREVKERDGAAGKRESDSATRKTSVRRTHKADSLAALSGGGHEAAG